MIEIIAVILLVIVWFVATGKSMDRFINNGAADLSAWGLGTVAVLMLAWGINAMLEHKRDNPCVAYESRLTYNAATKTMMPMRVCVERGEWVEVGNE
jgi:hypothetical protein